MEGNSERLKMQDIRKGKVSYSSLGPLKSEAIKMY